MKKDMIVEPEGATREVVDNGILAMLHVLDAGLPFDMVKDSGKILVSFTPSIVAQTKAGLMTCWYALRCGEQNMMLLHGCGSAAVLKPQARRIRRSGEGRNIHYHGYQRAYLQAR